MTNQLLAGTLVHWPVELVSLSCPFFNAFSSSGSNQPDYKRSQTMFDMKPAITPEVSLQKVNMVEMKSSGRYTHNLTSSERTQAHEEPTIVLRMASLVLWYSRMFQCVCFTSVWWWRVTRLQPTTVNGCDYNAGVSEGLLALHVSSACSLPHGPINSFTTVSVRRHGNDFCLLCSIEFSPDGI